MILALVLGTVLALAALAFVLHPLFVPPRGAAAPRASAGPAIAGGDDAVDVLREIEFDRETGKLSDHDYATLKATYTERALADLRVSDALAAGGAGAPPTPAGAAPVDAEDAAEAAIRRVRARMQECAACGPRPEPDALYCSSCGRYLPGACARCGATASEPGARFCNGCGDALAAA
jgi:hypothetical protein